MMHLKFNRSHLQSILMMSHVSQFLIQWILINLSFALVPLQTLTYSLGSLDSSNISQGPITDEESLKRIASDVSHCLFQNNPYGCV